MPGSAVGLQEARAFLAALSPPCTPPQHNGKAGQPCGLQPLLSQVSQSSPMKSQPIFSKTETSVLLSDVRDEK